MSGETQLKPFFFADEAIFTATCIPLLNRVPYQQPTKKQRAQRSPANVHTSWRLMARYDSMQLVARGSLQHKPRWRNSL